MPKNHIITGLDIGSNSIKVLSVLKKPSSSDFEVAAQIEEASFGIRRGVVVGVEEVSKKVSSALAEVQNLSGRKIDSAYVNISGGHIFVTPSRGVVVVSRADQKISQEDVNRVIQAAQAFSLPSNKEILNVFPKEFVVDGEGKIKEALGMQGVRLEVEVLALGAFSPYIRNLTNAVLGAGIQINDLQPSPLASARAVLTDQQKELGVAIVDIGAGTTDLAVFEEGNLVHLAVFPLGSAHITNDIAIGLKVDIDTAEKIKREFGSCVFQGTSKKDTIKISSDQAPLVFSRKMLTEIIQARICEIFDLINKELKKISRQELLPAGVVLTGGGSKLPKIVELAKKELRLPVQIGFPRELEGIEKDPCLSTVCGLVLGGIDLEEGGQDTFPVLGKEITTKFKKIFKIFIP